MLEEDILWAGNPSQLTNTGYYLLCIPLTLIAGLGLIMAVWRFLTTRATTYQLTKERLVTGEGVLSKQLDEIELYRVRDVRVTEPFILRLFGLGNVDIVTTDKSDEYVRLRAISKPRAVKEILRKHVESRRNQTRTREVEFT